MPPMDVIAEAGRNNQLVEILYRLKRTGEIREYILEPYSVRFGIYFYGYDLDDEHIKRFLIPNILRAEIVDEEFDPRWRVEF